MIVVIELLAREPAGNGPNTTARPEYLTARNQRAAQEPVPAERSGTRHRTAPDHGLRPSPPPGRPGGRRCPASGVRERLFVMLPRPGLQGENPGKKERS